MTSGKNSFYAKYIKRIFDFFISFVSIIVLSPLFLILTIIGAIAMKGNPFFIQERPGKNEKIFKLIKFRTMTNEKDDNGELLPNEIRLNSLYGKFLRKTSLDEIPELFCILIGDMALIGPRPLLVRYLPRYSKEQKHRHDVRPGLTGWAQVNGRNSISWEDKFKLDVWYTKNLSLLLDIKIIFMTIKSVLLHEGINSSTSVTMEEFLGEKSK